MYHHTKKKKNAKIEHTEFTKFQNNYYFLITPRTYVNNQEAVVAAAVAAATAADENDYKQRCKGK